MKYIDDESFIERQKRAWESNKRWREKNKEKIKESHKRYIENLSGEALEKYKEKRKKEKAQLSTTTNSLDFN